jgi:hypothetical protein
VRASSPIPLASCGPALRSRTCGVCVVSLIDAWYIRYYWRPTDSERLDHECSALRVRPDRTQ